MRENAEHTQDWKLSEDIKTGFSVPESYFKGLEDDFLLNLSEKKLPKNNVFEIPKTYFEEFDDHIIEKIKPKKGKLINFKKIKLIKIIETNGGERKSSVSSNTSFIIGGDKIGDSKKNKAQDLNIPIITEEDFNNLIS